MRGRASRIIAKVTAEPTMAKTKIKTAKVINADKKHPKGIIILLYFSYTIPYSTSSCQSRLSVFVVIT
jgi:hypothetical protein